MEADMSVQPAAWSIGPPPPRALTWLTRALQLSCLVVAAVWVLGFLGGLRLSPVAAGEGGANDTSGVFNWHPLLMTLAFPVLMGEAVLAYKAPLLALRDRQAKKVWHFGLQAAALVLVALALVPAFLSHTLKRPQPIPNLYSTHSILGITVVSLLALQFSVAAFSYLWPKLSLAQRRALGPLHIFLGKSIFTLGLATMAVGIQEKATFMQTLAKAPVFSAVMRLPAALQVLLALTGMAVLYHHVPPAASSRPATAETAEALPGSESQPLRHSFDGMSQHDL